MRRLWYVAMLAVATATQTLHAAPPEVPASLTAKVSQPVLFDVKLEAGKKLAFTLGYDKNKCPVVRLWSDDPNVYSFLALPAVDGEYYVSFITVGETVFSQTIIKVGAGPPVPPIPPDPKPPDPKPDPPTPAPEGFRVIFVYETAPKVPLSTAQQAIISGQKVGTYLNAKSKGWRLYDKDVIADNEKDPAIKALWQAVTDPANPQRLKPENVPCMVVAVGGKAEILPLPANEDEALKLFMKLGG